MAASLLGPEPKADIVELYGRHVSSGKRDFFRAIGLELVMGRREGAYFEDLDGRRLLNCHCNGGVFNLGHSNPRIVEALRRAALQLDIGNHHLISEARARLAARLAASAPGDLDRAAFASGGGEAIDLAIKLARGHTGRPGVVSAVGGYHGHTGLALAAGDPCYRVPFEPLAPGFVQVPFDDAEALARAVNDDTAAVLLETVPATLGMRLPAPGYFSAVREICDRHGAQLIADEVQTGLGRTGRMWGIEHFDVVPDIMVTAKGLGGGVYPMAATIYRPHLEAFLRKDPFVHISTTGGAELGCAVALEVLAMVQAPGFLEGVRQRAALLADGLADLRARSRGLLAAVRQLGMMIGLVTPDENLGPLFCRLAAEEGLFCVYANHDRRVVQFLLPLVVDEAQAQQALAGVGRTLERLAGLVGGAR